MRRNRRNTKQRISNKNISVFFHPTDGFTLHIFYGNALIHKRYIGYSLIEAKRRFKIYVKQEATNVQP